MRRSDEAGWVLMETLVALVLLSIGVLAINRAVRETLATRAIARDYTVARFLLDEKMGELEMLSVHQEGASSSGDFGEEHPRFKYAWSIERVDLPEPDIPQELKPFILNMPALPEPYLGRISVTISWTRAGRPFSTKAETLISSKRILVKEPPDVSAQPAA